MTWTYDAPTPGTHHEVRYLVGDTDPDDPIVQDEEIKYLLDIFPPQAGKPAWLAAANTAESIAAKYAREINSNLGPLSSQAEQQYQHYVEVARRLRMLYVTGGLDPEAVNETAAGNILKPALAAPILYGGGPTYLGNNSPAWGGGIA